MVNGQHPVWKATALIREGKNRSALWAELLAVFSAAMDELNSVKFPTFWFLPAHGSGQWPGHLSRQEGNGNLVPVEIPVGI